MSGGDWLNVQANDYWVGLGVGGRTSGICNPPESSRSQISRLAEVGPVLVLAGFLPYL